MKIQLPYGHGSLQAHIPDQYDVELIDVPHTAPAADPLEVVDNAIQNLLGNISWSDFSGVESVGIAVNDKTRPVPHKYLLPPLLNHLNNLGISDEIVTFYIAVGSHPPMMPEEFIKTLPDLVIQRCKIISHDCEDDDSLVFIGNTSGGTPVWANRGFISSDLKIVVGNIEPHQFAGFSGGVKSAAIGLAGKKTISSNHSLMTQSGSIMGNYSNNPTRQDIEEIGKMMGVTLALNAILNHDKEIVHALAGTPAAVMETGIQLSRSVCQVKVSQTYGLVIASSGGHPKDINVYQAQKGLVPSSRITKPGGTLILVAACPEGSGSPHYQEWMQGMESFQAVKERFWQEGFRIGAHKAFLFARNASDLNLVFCSQLNEDLARSLLLIPCQDLQTAIDKALVDLPAGEKIAVMPHAATTLTALSEER